MKVLYIAAEHVSGTLSLFQAEHRRRGDDCRFVTFWHSRWDFPDDICLHLPLMPNRSWVKLVREGMHRLRPPTQTRSSESLWQPGRLEQWLFAWRDRVNWPRIAAAIEQYELSDFDIIHLDGGLDFTRDGRFIKSCANRGAHIAAFFHGSDLRNRGAIASYENLIELRITSEWDLLEVDPRLRYLYLPLDTARIAPRDYSFHSPVRICHAARNPHKGTKHIEEAVRRLKSKHKVELVLLRNLPHAEAMRVKSTSDIFVDQLTNAGGWGYGMSSVEALAMGMPVVTNIPPMMANHIGDHPFVQADPSNIEDVLDHLINDEAACLNLAEAGRRWVQARHDVRRVGDQLYGYYRELGWTQTR